ncbi:transporter, CPA2 family [Gottschalkia purinilytica]|uniref:Transporter, CPA2 family n=1 Tax=Gottschalkia purinilytica TaxID=1503 RepID=A0A0L0WBW5_GOTPU|nr:cation:proton antiporter [Gottschalkia purinilytica]KNF08958.1 transporter, CPA2 family [Gottschalkia purinilytica]
MFNFNLASHLNPFISLGIALIIGVLFAQFMNKLKVPAVAGYIIGGLIIGVSTFKLIDQALLEKLSFISDFALGIIAFNIGSELKFSEIKKLGKSIFIIALCEALGAFILVTTVTFVVTKDLAMSLILGAVSSATAPAATVMVLKEYRAKGSLTSTLLGVVAVDDAICLMIYSISASIAKVFIKHEKVTLYKILINPLGEIIFSIIMGMILGIVLSYFLKKAKKETDMLAFSIASILLIVGLSTKFQLSPLLSAMSMGISVANISTRSDKVFRTLESFSPPIINVFFILAGARLQIGLLPKIGLIGILYLVFRIIGKIIGASLGAKISNAPEVVKKYIGFGLLSQVGVAVGLAIIVSNEFAGTSLGSIVITILLATTIITEILGPIATKNAIIKSGEANI